MAVRGSICKGCGYLVVDHRAGVEDPVVPDICLRLQSSFTAPGAPGPNVKLRLWGGGPEVDLGCDAPTLVSESLSAISELAKKTPGYMLSPILAKAMARIKRGSH